MTAPDSREAMQAVALRCRTAHDEVRRVLTDLRDVEVTAENVYHVNHIERELNEALARLDGARFTAEAALARAGRP